LTFSRWCPARDSNPHNLLVKSELLCQLS